MLSHRIVPTQKQVDIGKQIGRRPERATAEAGRRLRSAMALLVTFRVEDSSKSWVRLPSTSTTAIDFWRTRQHNSGAPKTVRLRREHVGYYTCR